MAHLLPQDVYKRQDLRPCVGVKIMARVERDGKFGFLLRARFMDQLWSGDAETVVGDR